MSLTLDLIPRKALRVRRDDAIVAAVWIAPELRRPYVYPFAAPDGIEVTRRGHPLDPIGHSHHESIWIAHRDVGSVNFWEDSHRAGRIEVTDVEIAEPKGRRVEASIECRWKAPDGNLVLREERGLAFVDLPGDELALELTVSLQSATDADVTLGETPFGLLGIRVARTMRVAEKLGGWILNSSGSENESECFWQHASWCDYSGPVVDASGLSQPERAGVDRATLPAAIAGIACFDDPKNTGDDTLWHVRDDGWMGPCLTKRSARTIEAKTPTIIRYRIESHAGRPGDAAIAERYRRWRRSLRSE